MLGASPADGGGNRRFFSDFGSRALIARGQISILQNTI
jgi:hypothetical protein